MGTVTGLTAERMDEIIDKTIVDANVVSNNLILSLQDGSTIDAGAVTYTPPLLVTSSANLLAINGFDGQEVFYKVAAGIIWHLRYDLGTDRWEFVGGPELTATIATEESTSAGGNTYQDLATVGPDITIPLAGDYRVQVGAEASVASGLANAMAWFMSYRVTTGAEASDADGWRLDLSNAGQGGRFCPTSHPLTKTYAAGNIVRCRYRDGSANHSATYGKRWIRITPKVLLA